MGTLKVDNLQKRDGTALITDGAASTTLLSQSALKSAGVREIKIATASAYQVQRLFLIIQFLHQIIRVM